MKSETFIFNLLVSIIFIMNAKQIVLGVRLQKKLYGKMKLKKRKKVQIEIENEEITFV